MIFIGRTRAEAIDWVQESLGPITPRNIAEDTYRGLCTEGVISRDRDLDCIVMLEDMDQEDLRMRARNGIIAGANQRAGKVRQGRAMRHNRCHNRHNRHDCVTAQTPYTSPCGDEDEDELN